MVKQPIAIGTECYRLHWAVMRNNRGLSPHVDVEEADETVGTADRYHFNVASSRKAIRVGDLQPRKAV